MLSDIKTSKELQAQDISTMMVEGAVAWIDSLAVQGFESWMPWDTNPLYALLHESIYCQGAKSAWAAQRVREAEFSEEFDARHAAQNGRPVYFTGGPSSITLGLPQANGITRSCAIILAGSDILAKVATGNTLQYRRGPDATGHVYCTTVPLHAHSLFASKSHLLGVLLECMQNTW